MSPATFVLDRIEGDRAVVEVAGELIDLPCAALPPGAREGDSFALAPVETDALAEARARLDRLRKRDSGGSDFEL